MVAKYPAIPEPTIEPTSLRDAVLSLKQAFEIHTGQRGNPNYRALLPEDLVNTTEDVAANTADIATNTTNIATNTASIAAHESAWTTYTPTVAAGTGTFINVSAAGRYKTIGKTVFVSVNVTITTNGTASGYVTVTLPFAAAASLSPWILAGRENAVAGLMLVGVVGSAASFMFVQNHNATYPGANGYVLALSGVYERA